MARPRKPRSAANGAGTVEWRNGKPFVRLTLPDGRRPRIPIPPEYTTPERHQECAAAMAELARAGKLVFDPPKPRGKAALLGPTKTVRDVMKAWTKGELLSRYGSVNKLRTIASARIIEWTLEKHAMGVKTRGPGKPAFGDLPVGDVTTKDISEVMAQHAAGRAQTKQHTYNRLHRLFDLAIFPLELRPEGSNPVSRYLRPTSDDEKTFCFLYPAEVLALLSPEASNAIPVGRRVLYALAVFTGLRKGNLYGLRWRDIDFVNGTITVPRTKTGRGLFFDVNAGLLGVLRAWKRLSGDPVVEALVIRDVGCERGREAQTLRDDLAKVGVIRADLHIEDDPEREPLRFHDLRATFVTWAKRAERPDDWIRSRTGHVDDDMLERYARAAKVLADLRYEPFPDISGAIPELAALSHPLSQPWISTGLPEGAGGEVTAENQRECEGGDLNPYGSNPASTSRETPSTVPHAYVANDTRRDTSKGATAGAGTAGDSASLAELVGGLLGGLAALAVTLPQGALDALAGAKG
ncbi:MAG TPA: tyrosine-type recombinase/integrase [Polyangiaceae bacterium]|nr:tyrosine-type recombinase/integrase [Polyangiaceae bacterium]